MNRSRPWRWPLLVLALSLALTGWLWQHERQMQDLHLRRGFDFGVRQAAARVEQRVASIELTLRALRGLFEAGGAVDGRSFAGFVDVLLAGADSAGLRSMGYAPLREAGGHARAPTTFVAPATDAALATLGDDALADPLRAAAMAQARDSGSTAMTRRLRPAGSGAGAAGAGELVAYMPLYTPGAVLDGVAARRRAITGWVYARFAMADLMASLYGEGLPGLALRIDEGSAPSADALLFASEPAAGAPARAARFEAQEYLGVAGRTWTLGVHSTPAFEEPPGGRDAVRVIAVTGTGLAVLGALLTWLLVTGRDRAASVARAMTRQLRESAERYRRIVETAEEGIWLVDVAGRTTFANPKLQRLVGASAGSLQGRHWSELVDPADVAADRPGDAPPRMPPHGRELRLRREDGSVQWVQLHTSPLLDERGQHAGALAMVTDVTERRQSEARRALLESQLRQSQKMEAIGTLAGGIAHDFNNILAAILGNLSLLRAELGEPHAAQPRLAQIGDTALRARSLVQQIVAFSRREPQQLVAQPLEPLLDDAVRLLRSTLPVRVSITLALPEAPLWVAVDATQLQQVLMNLCTNAWHAFGPEGGGRIEVGAEPLRLSADEAAQLGLAGPGGSGLACARLWVNDDGCGMTDATRARIFEPFFTTKPAGQGTGLGLAVVHGIVAAHGGAIAVESAPGQGSRFDLYLPLASTAPPPARGVAPPAPAPAALGAHVLYVDDDPVMVVVVHALLARAGWRVTSLDDPQRALAVATAPGSDVAAVVSDYNMPGMSGLDLARRLAQQRPGLPVLISSGYVTDTLRAEAAAAGVRGVLQKEFTTERLVPLLGETLGRSQGDAHAASTGGEAAAANAQSPVEGLPAPASTAPAEPAGTAAWARSQASLPS